MLRSLDDNLALPLEVCIPGKIAWSRNRWIRLSIRTFSAFALCLSSSSASPAGGLPTLTRVSQIRHLSRDEAKRGYPVRIRGVITNDVPSPDFVVQDGTGGVYILGSRNPSFSHHFGDLVEVNGITGQGFAPVILEKSFRRIGRGSLPESHPYTVGQLMGGSMDSQWVRVQGVVRSALVDRTSWREPALNLNLIASGGEFEVRVPLLDGPMDDSTWVGSELVVEGVCGSLSNAAHQFTGLILYVPRTRFLNVVGKVGDVPIESLLQFSPDRPPGERVRVRGVVTFQQPGEMLFLESGEASLRVQTQQASHFALGDVVEAEGFPKMGDSKPVLEAGIVRRVGHQIPPVPQSLHISPPFERFDGALVSTKAVLVERNQQPDGLSMVLNQDGFTFNAVVPAYVRSDRFLSIPLRSTLNVVGIGLVHNGGVWRTPASFTILVRSAQDISIVGRPPWWNFHHAVWVIGITLPTLLFAVLWVIALQGRLRRQVDLYRQKLHSGAILEERNRIARELHDSIEQDLAGIIFQLDLAADCFIDATPIARQALENARNMSRRGMLEARRSVWDMRCHLLENGDLVYALRQVVELLNQRNQTQIEFNVCGLPTRVAKEVELNLLRIAQEAMANALKHARATKIRVTLTFDSRTVQLTVNDDGKGFESGEIYFDGHFGLADMHERASAVGSTLRVHSQIGLGTLVELEVAL